jgi:hypothetical protein
MEAGRMIREIKCVTYALKGSTLFFRATRNREEETGFGSHDPVSSTGTA